MDNIIFEDPSQLPKPSKRSLGSLSQPQVLRHERPGSFVVEGTQQVLRSPADPVSRIGKLGSHVVSKEAMALLTGCLQGCPRLLNFLPTFDFVKQTVG